MSLTIERAEVHCLLGQNGAGKSTLIKILAGAQSPDRGELLWCGEPVEFHHPTAALGRGIATIYQELDLIGGLPVEDNIFWVTSRKRSGGLEARDGRDPLGRHHQSDGAVFALDGGLGLARLSGLGRGLSETTEKVVPSSITLYSAVVTKDNVAQYEDVGF